MRNHQWRYFIVSRAFNINASFARSLVKSYLFFRPSDRLFQDLLFVLSLSTRKKWPTVFHHNTLTQLHDEGLEEFFATKCDDLARFMVVTDRTIGQFPTEMKYGKLAWQKISDFDPHSIKVFLKYQELRAHTKRPRLVEIRSIEQSASQYLKLADKKEYTFRDPKICHKLDAERPLRSVLVPEQYFALVENVEITKGFQIIKDEKLVLYDTSADFKNANVSGLRQHFNYVGMLNDKETCVYFEEKNVEIRHLDEVILISGRATENYFHWLIEYLPRMKNIPSDFSKNVPLLVKSGLHKQFYEVLGALADGRPILKIDPTSVRYFAQKVWVPSPHTYHPDNFDLPHYEGGALSLEHLSYVREKVFEEYEKIERSTGQIPEKIFLDRSASRAITNADEIRQLMFRFGFVTVYPENLNFWQQVQLFKGAKFVVGPAGASLSNLIFSNHPTVISLLAKKNETYVNQCNLAEFAGADFYHFVGISDRPREAFADEESYAHASFSIDADKLQMTLEQKFGLSQVNV